MRILFDQGTPVPLRRHLPTHRVNTALERGWDRFENGDLLDSAEYDAYDILITTDQNLKYQQNLSGRKLAILVLSTTSWPRIKRQIAEIQAAVEAIHPGDYVEVAV